MIRNALRLAIFVQGPVCLALSLLAGEPAALAQNALGSGNALDANTRVGGGGTNFAGRDIRQELAFRNAIVTGNAGAGLSFRGDIGYRAADDFRSTAGSDRLYDFRRDSDYSGLATLNIRGISSMQDQFNFATGGQTRSNVVGDLIVQRSSAGFSGRDLGNEALESKRIDPLARLGAGSLRSTSNGFLRDTGRPSVLAYQDKPGAENAEGANLMIASPLQGVRTIPEKNAVFGFTPAPITGLQSPEQIAAIENKKLLEMEADRPASSLPSFVSPFDTFRNQLASRVEGRVDSKAIDTNAKSFNKPVELPAEERAKLGLPGGNEEPKPGDAEKTAAAKNDFSENLFDARMQRLRDVLSGKEDETLAVAPAGRPVVPGLDSPAPEAPIPGVESNAQRPKAIDPATMVPGSQAEKDERIRKAIEDARGLLDSPQQISTLAPSTTSDQLFLGHMKKGEQFLADGRWFDAEERFALALSLRAGDPLAAAGRVHAQIAAGMYLSAALNLRNTLRAYPELMAAKYAAELLPRGERLNTVRAQLKARSTRDTLVARDAGFLLTYLGWQTGNPQDVAEGLAIVDRVNEKMGIEPDPLDATIRGVWLSK